MSVAVCPGSFDPVTLGHIDIIRRSARLFDKVYVPALVNSEKRYMFSHEQRVDMLRLACADIENVVVESYDGMLADYASAKGADIIVKGLRDAADFPYEQGMALANKFLSPGLETLFLSCDPALSHVSSTFVRELIKQKRDASALLPKQITKIIKTAY